MNGLEFMRNIVKLDVIEEFYIRILGTCPDGDVKTVFEFFVQCYESIDEYGFLDHSLHRDLLRKTSVFNLQVNHDFPEFVFILDDLVE